MSERPYQPFYKPYGMTDEEYEYEKRIAAEKLAEWEQEQNESNLLDAQVIKKNADGLLPCPFCGEYPKIGSLGGDKQNWAIWCKCQIPCAETGLSGDTKEEIIIAWNNRK